MLQVGQRVALDLPDALAADLQLTPDLLQRGRLPVEAEPQLEHTPLALRQPPDRLAHRLGAQRLGRLGLRIDGGRIGEQVAELALAVRADGLVQRHGRLDRAERLLHVTQLETGRLGELLVRWLLATRSLQPLAGTVQLHAPLVYVRRDADRRGLVRDRTLAGLANPPGRVGRELETLAPVELLDGAVQADHALLDQVSELEAVALVALRDRDDEPQVRVDHALLRRGVAALHSLGQRDLVRCGEQRITAGLVHEQRQAVRRPGCDLGPGRRLRMGRRDELDAALLELGPERRKLLLVELVLVGVRPEDLLLELSELLRLDDEGAWFDFSKLGQFSHSSTSLKNGRLAGRHISYNACSRAYIPTGGPDATAGASESYALRAGARCRSSSCRSRAPRPSARTTSPPGRAGGRGPRAGQTRCSAGAGRRAGRRHHSGRAGRAGGLRAPSGPSGRWLRLAVRPSGYPRFRGEARSLTLRLREKIARSAALYKTFAVDPA